MQFNSVNFLIFFPIVVILYYIIPKRFKKIWLLAASYFFYMSWNAKYASLIAFSTVTTFFVGLRLQRAKYKKLVLGIGITVNIGLLFFFKYFDFFIHSMNMVFGRMHLKVLNNPFNLVLPVGISFYVFQAVGYIIDVYRGEIEAENNIVNYALFVSFFPQLVAGPIERSKNLLRQIKENTQKVRPEYLKITNGLIYMLYGLFMKMVISDRVAILVDNVFDHYDRYGGLELLVAAVCFSIQIYCDFSAYSTIAIGAAEVMGFTLMENFHAPYFATSIADFWRKWHISLSTWLRDYVYIPLGGNRKGKIRKDINLFITFFISGLWHGASWTYVLWGIFHAVCQIIGEHTKNVRIRIYELCGVNTKGVCYKAAKMLTTFLLVTLGWIMFRASGIRNGINYIIHIVTRWNPWAIRNQCLWNLGLDHYEWMILLGSLWILLLVDLIRLKTGKRIDLFLTEQGAFVKGCFVFLLVMMIFIYGKYGEGYDAKQFIYFQF